MRFPARLMVACIGLVSTTSSLQAQINVQDFRIIALSGNALEPSKPQLRYTPNFLTPSINDNNQVLFLAEVADTNSTDTAIILREDNDTTIVAQTNQPLPDNPSQTYNRLARPVLANDGVLAFSAEINDNSNFSFSSSILSNINGDLEMFATTDQPTPDGGVFTSLNNPTIDRQSGHIAFTARFKNPNLSTFFNEGIYQTHEPSVFDDATLILTAREGSPVSDGNIITSFEEDILIIDNQVQFRAGIGTSVRGLRKDTILQATTNNPSIIKPNPSIVAIDGPTPDDDFTFTTFHHHNKASFAPTAFTASLDISTGQGIDDASDTALYTPTTLIAQEGENLISVLGGETGTFLGDLGNTKPITNNNGNIAFRAPVSYRTQANGDSILSEPGEAIILAQNLGPDDYFITIPLSTELGLNNRNDANDFLFIKNFNQSALNDNDIIVVLATLGDGSHTALIGYDIEQNETFSLAQSGVTFDINPHPDITDLRTIATIDFDPTSGLNNKNIVAYRLNFTDGEAAIITNQISPIPEPRSALLITLLIPTVLRRRSHQPTP
ncbi:DUF7453 family protein [Mucisphaera sp.]|uniref:DUF7453 family protein n=1 Tax=Mucisphaera sp. TaxID=2913024 RepID=UPI003D0C8AAD